MFYRIDDVFMLKHPGLEPIRRRASCSALEFGRTNGASKRTGQPTAPFEIPRKESRWGRTAALTGRHHGLSVVIDAQVVELFTPIRVSAGDR